MENLNHLLRLYEEGHLSAVAFEKALNVLNPPIKELSRLLQLHDLRYIGHKALDSALYVLTPPSKYMDEEETVEPYDEPWCKPLKPSPNPRQIKINSLCTGGNDAGRSVVIYRTGDDISVYPKIGSTFAPQIGPQN